MSEQTIPQNPQDNKNKDCQSCALLADELATTRTILHRLVSRTEALAKDAENALTEDVSQKKHIYLMAQRDTAKRILESLLDTIDGGETWTNV